MARGWDIDYIDLSVQSTAKFLPGPQTNHANLCETYHIACEIGYVFSVVMKDMLVSFGILSSYQPQKVTPGRNMKKHNNKKTTKNNNKKLQQNKPHPPPKKKKKKTKTKQKTTTKHNNNSNNNKQIASSRHTSLFERERQAEVLFTAVMKDSDFAGF